MTIISIFARSWLIDIMIYKITEQFHVLESTLLYKPIVHTSRTYLIYNTIPYFSIGLRRTPISFLFCKKILNFFLMLFLFSI